VHLAKRTQHPSQVVPARGTPRRSRRGDPVAGTHDHRPVFMGPGSPPAFARVGRDDDRGNAFWQTNPTAFWPNEAKRQRC
jgi:hypothetical protein